jgi:hypothetical protein
VRALLVVLVVSGCHHAAAPVATSEPPPSSTGTPIGYLIDASAQLGLRDEQAVALRAIDIALADDLKTIDAKLRVATRAKKTDGAAPPMGRSGGMRGGMMRSGAGRSQGRSRAGSASAKPAGSVDQLMDLRIAAVHDAVKRALAALDPAQRASATKLLEEHDVDVDVDHPGIPDDDSAERAAADGS